MNKFALTALGLLLVGCANNQGGYNQAYYPAQYQQQSQSQTVYVQQPAPVLFQPAPVYYQPPAQQQPQQGSGFFGGTKQDQQQNNGFFGGNRINGQ